ncbi:hypothetical protein [Streptomyces sp. AP-93]|uniref:hypothetical protein n=1 Tax=Streptomyces sp. AP-93 TaxID=2929048 RepID=UPI001FB0422B|nr:hypothetical protein [Streptomyces sp. AP-93]MCJ0869167.1 hypothetical protein [Streptomyces sp. AP-93]
MLDNQQQFHEPDFNDMDPCLQPQPDASSVVDTVLRIIGVGSQQDLSVLRGAQEEADLRLLLLEQRVERIEQSCTSLQHRQKKLESKIDNLLAARTRERPDLATSNHSTHQVIATDYRAVVEQRIQGLARSQVAGSRMMGRYSDRQIIPRFIGLLCEQLFTQGVLLQSPHIQRNLGLASDALAVGPIDSVRGVCQELRHRSRQAGLAAVWDFTYTRGVALNHDMQEPWPSCDPRAPVRFVVAPAYMVDDRVFARQYVYTSSDEWE